MALRVSDLEELQAADRGDVERCQAGDAAAFDELYRRHHDRLLRFCTARLGDRYEAEDVVAEAFARAWRSMPTFAGERRFYPWLRVVVANLCTDHQRRHGRVTPSAEIDVEALVDRDALAEEADRAVVRAALARLAPRHRDVLELRERDELSYEQIAARAGVSLGTVESLLWRARQALRREYAQLTAGEGLAGVAVLGPLLLRLRLAGRRARDRVARGALPWGDVSPMAHAVAAGIAGLVVAGVITGVGLSGGGHRGGAVTVVAPPAGAIAPATRTVPAASPGAAGPPSSAAPGARGGPAGRAAGSTSSADPSSARAAATPGAGTTSASRPRASLSSPLAAGAAQAGLARRQPVGASVGDVTLGADPYRLPAYAGRVAGYAGQTVGAPLSPGAAPLPTPVTAPSQR